MCRANAAQHEPDQCELLPRRHNICMKRASGKLAVRRGPRFVIAAIVSVIRSRGARPSEDRDRFHAELRRGNGRDITPVLLPGLALSSTSCLATRWLSRGGWFMWPGGFLVILILLIVTWLVRRARASARSSLVGLPHKQIKESACATK